MGPFEPPGVAPGSRTGWGPFSRSKWPPNRPFHPRSSSNSTKIRPSKPESAPRSRPTFWSAAGSGAPRRFGLAGEPSQPQPKRCRRCALPPHSKTFGLVAPAPTPSWTARPARPYSPHHEDSEQSRRMKMRYFFLLLCAAVVVGAGTSVCKLHKKPMTKKKADVILLVCRHNQDEWQQYTNARARLFPKSCDEIYLDASEVSSLTSKQLQKKYGWKSVPSHLSISVCPTCDERKAQWLAAHPPKKYEKGEIPPP